MVWISVWPCVCTQAHRCFWKVSRGEQVTFGQCASPATLSTFTLCVIQPASAHRPRALKVHCQPAQSPTGCKERCFIAAEANTASGLCSFIQTLSCIFKTEYMCVCILPPLLSSLQSWEERERERGEATSEGKIPRPQAHHPGRRG